MLGIKALLVKLKRNEKQRFLPILEILNSQGKLYEITVLHLKL